MYYSIEEAASFVSDSTERPGRLVGIAEHVGHAMTFKILTEDTLMIIYHSCVHSATDPASVSLHADDVSADPGHMHTDPDINTVPPQSTICSCHDTADGKHSDFLLPFVIAVR